MDNCSTWLSTHRNLLSKMQKVGGGGDKTHLLGALCNGEDVTADIQVQLEDRRQLSNENVTALGGLTQQQGQDVLIDGR